MAMTGPFFVYMYKAFDIEHGTCTKIWVFVEFWRPVWVLLSFFTETWKEREGGRMNEEWIYVTLAISWPQGKTYVDVKHLWAAPWVFLTGCKSAILHYFYSSHSLALRFWRVQKMLPALMGLRVREDDEKGWDTTAQGYDCVKMCVRGVGGRNFAFYLWSLGTLRFGLRASSCCCAVVSNSIVMISK